MVDPGEARRRSRTPIERFLSPFQRFAKTESSGGLVLLACTALALVWANSPLGAGYFALWRTPLRLQVGALALDLPLQHWIDDGLMTVFFFLVGLEIKRELLSGELASPRRAMLPVAGAVGGMLVPAALYALLNAGSAGARGWGIPMATDIAFALGVLALLGPRVPAPLKVFLAALAIVDDIGAVLVIALFYSTGISFQALGFAAIVVLVTLLANRVGVWNGIVYAGLGVLLWLAMLASGIHVTIAGVILAALVPARPRLGAGHAVRRARGLADQIARTQPADTRAMPTARQLDALGELEDVSRFAQAPAQRIERALHPWVAFGIVPLFALANAGVRVLGPGNLDWRITLGVIVGLVLGKPIGITAASWLSTRLGGQPPAATGAGGGGAAAGATTGSWRALHGVSWLGGIGFTMSLFIAQLAFASDGPLASAKLGILGASVLAALIGSGMLLRLGRRRAAAAGRTEATSPRSAAG